VSMLEANEARAGEGNDGPFQGSKEVSEIALEKTVHDRAWNLLNSRNTRTVVHECELSCLSGLFWGKGATKYNGKEDYHFQQNSMHANRLVICKLAME
jgi:hypothetical protein